MNAIGTTKNSVYQIIEGSASANLGARNLRRCLYVTEAVTESGSSLSFCLVQDFHESID